MARITVYKNSILASICSILGYIFMIGGVIVAINEDVVGGLLIAACGVGLSFLANSISEKKQFKQWKKQVENEINASVIQNSVHAAIHVYNTYPCKNSLEYIRELNPQAAKQIDEELFAKKNQ